MHRIFLKIIKIKYDINLISIKLHMLSEFLLISLKNFMKQINFKSNSTWYIKFINF